MNVIKKLMNKKGSLWVMRGALVILFFVSVIALKECKGLFKQSGAHQVDLNQALEAENVVPLLIIGSGPAGLGAAIYGVRGLIHTVVIEGNAPGGLLTKTTDVENWPGDRSIKGPELIDRMHEHAQGLGVEFLHDAVVSIDCATWPFTVATDNGLTIRALSVVIATGASPKLLGIPGEQEYWGNGVTSCAICDAPFFKGEDVIVIGGGDSAAEEALQAAQWVKKVTVLVRGDKMRAAAGMQKRIAAYPSIEIVYNTAVQEVVGEDYKNENGELIGTVHSEGGTFKRVTGVKIRNTATGEAGDMPARAVFLAIGHTPNSDLFKNCVDIDAHGYIKTLGRTQQTSQAGVFAAGEVEDDHYRQAIVSAGRGASAGLDALSFLSEIGFSSDFAKKLKLWSPSGRAMGAGHIGTLISLAEFEKLITEVKQPIVLDFYGQNCPSCKQLVPMVEGLSQQFAEKVSFFTVDAGIAVDLAEKFFIYKVPCFLIFKDGKLMARYTPRPDQAGSVHKDELAGLIEQALSAA